MPSAAKKLSDDYVVTPGGARHKSLVHVVEAGSTVSIGADRWIVKNEQGHVYKEILPHLHQVSSLSTGWIVYTSWGNSTGSPVSQVTTSWTVPPFPGTESGQLIYLFNAIETIIVNPDPNLAGGHIFQPVLQWGNSPDGGGNSWAIASWFAGSLTQPSTKTPLVGVTPGMTLTGQITLTGVTGALLNYRCEFLGFPGTVLNVMIPAPYACTETLECYGITACTDYPATDRTRMKSIVVSTQAGTPAGFAWNVTVAATDCAQNIDVVDGSATGGQVDIVYPRRGIGGYDLQSTADRLFAFDYDGSGHPDHFVAYRPGTGVVWVLRNDDVVLGGASFGAELLSHAGLAGYDFMSPDDQAFAFDLTGTGKLDHIVVYRPGAGNFVVLDHSTGTFRIELTGTSGVGGIDFHSPVDRAIPLDPGSGYSNHLFVYRPGSGIFRILRFSGGSFKIDSLGSAGIGGYDLKSTADQVLTFDGNGDGAMDHLVLYRPGAGAVYVLAPSGSSYTPIYRQDAGGSGLGIADLSSPADRIVAIDYNGFGYRDHLLVYRPGTGFVWIMKRDGPDFVAVSFSDSGIGGYDMRSAADVITTFDYEKTGKQSYLVCYRPGGGAVFILKNSAGTFTPVYQGY
jgi:hypothetical protein